MTSKARMLSGAAAGLGFLMLVLYLVLIMNEGDDTVGEVAPWALAMAVASAVAAVGAATARHRLVFFAGVIFIVIGVPAIFSIGFPLIVAGLLSVLTSSHPTARPEAH